MPSFWYKRKALVANSIVMPIRCQKVVFPILTFLLTLSIFGCGAYFNTYYNAKKFFKEAEKKRLQQQKKSPSAKLSTKIPEYQKAIEKGSKVLQLYPRSRYVDDAIMIIGKSFYHQGEYLKAKRKFEELITLLPNSPFVPQAKLWLARSLIQLQEYEEAEEVLVAVLAEKTSSQIAGEAQMLLGKMFFQRRLYQRAIQEFSGVIRTHGRGSMKAQAQFHIGECYWEIGEYAKAANAFLKVQKYNPDFELQYESQLRYGQALRYLKKYDQATEVFSRLMDKFSSNQHQLATLRLEVAGCLADQGKLNEAILALENIIKDFPKTAAAAEAYYRLGEIFLYSYGQFDEARKNLHAVKKEYASSDFSKPATELTKSIDEVLKLRRQLKKYEADLLLLTTTQPDTTDTVKVEKETKSVVSPVFEPPITPVADTTSQRKMSNSRATQLLDEDVNLKSQPKSSVSVPQDPQKLRRLYVQDRLKLAELFLFRFSMPDSALGQYEKLYNQFPDDSIAAQSLYAIAYVNENYLGNTSVADSLYRQLIEKYPQTRFARYAARHQGITSVDSVTTKVKLLFHLAEQSWMEKQDFKQAINFYQQIVENYSDTDYAAKALYAIAWLHEYELHDNDKALEFYRTLEKLYPQSVYARKVQKKITAVDTSATQQGGIEVSTPKSMAPKTAETIEKSQRMQEPALPTDTTQAVRKKTDTNEKIPLP